MTIPQIRGMYHGDKARKEVAGGATASACPRRWTTAR